MQIRDARTDAAVGTGIVVSTGGKIVTCAHVFQAAAGVTLRDAEGAEVGVYFSQARGGEEKSRRAKINACFLSHDDDVVLLQLIGGPPPLAPEQIPILGKAEPSQGNPFGSYGYRRLGDYIAGHARGTIMGCVEKPENRNVQLEPVQLESSQINRGMSGAAVLDTERDLIVGIVSETWFPDRSLKDRDTAWAVNARVLSLEPLSLELQDEPHAKRPAPQPRTDIAAARAAVAPDLGVEWNNAPASLPEWVGREDMLKAISADWNDPRHRVTGLIGFGGEGKSSLARQWLDDLLADNSQPKPDGVFWWGFYTSPSVDEFFEAALKYMSGGRIDPRRLPSGNLKAQEIGAMLGAGRYIFVLDGLEIMQHQEGDQYGLLKSDDLREFLRYLATPGHDSFCLITSRAPVLDLMEYTTHEDRDVTRLSKEDGRALLRELGVKGDDAELDRIVADWDGHALTLSLIGAYVVDLHAGKLTHIDMIKPPTADEPRYERVHRVLRRYDEHLTDAERAFLKLFSAFRMPVEESAFEKVFRVPVKQSVFNKMLRTISLRKTRATALNAPMAALGDKAFDAMVKRLVGYRILRYDPHARHYTAHPLIRNHYLDRLKECDRAQIEAAHKQIKDYYLEIAGDVPHTPALDDLAPLIEAVHHACQAGAYDDAFQIYRERIDQRNRWVLSHLLGAYETDLALMIEFFPGGDTTQAPQVSAPGEGSFILNLVGLCLMNLGRLREAVPLFERYNEINLTYEDWKNASIGYQNLAELHAYLGALAASATAAHEAVAFARRAGNIAGNIKEELGSLARQAWTSYLFGELEAAGETFGQAESLQRKIGPEVSYLYSFRGIQHADYLRRSGENGYARRVTDANLEICGQQHWLNSLSLCHRVLGDLDADAGQREKARGHYDEAVKIARSITHRPALIEALLARGRWTARHLKDSPAAFSDLNEALDYAVDGEYRIYEADIHVAFAWANLAAGDHSKARAEAERARHMSAQMEYHWGQVDAAEVLKALDA